MAVNIYRVRQALLRELKEQLGAPMSVGDVLAVSAEPAIVHFPEEAARQWRELAAFGYIEAVPGFGGGYFRLAEKGLRQLAVEFQQDPFVWGPGAK